MGRKFEVGFAMCHCEYTSVELDEEDIKDKTEGEIESLIEEIAWRQIQQECPAYIPEEIIEIIKVED